MAPINAKITAADEINAKATLYNQWLEKKVKYNKNDDDYKKQNSLLEAKKKEKLELIQAAKFPIEGLSYSESGLTYNGYPFISDGEYLKISFMIAKALKGDLSIATFENFSLLDPIAQQEIIKESHAAGFQVFVEIVTGDNPDQDGFYIEDGELVEEEVPKLEKIS